MTRVQDWRRFVLAHGWRAQARDLAHVVGQPLDAVLRLRTTHACTRLKHRRSFADLFSMWHGRAPVEADWPVPSRAGGAGYEWQAPELALLASLVGRVSKTEIARVLTDRLRKLTGDRHAERGALAVQNTMSRIGLQTTDVVGGITLADAGREVGAYYLVWNAIQRKELRRFRVGRLWVIPHDAWAAWKAKRVFAPKGFVQLSKLREPLGMHSDKLPEYAGLGYIPTAVRCNPWGVHGIKTTKYGTWFIDAKVARKLLADRRAGRAMPWCGKPSPSNLRQTWKLLVDRMHPASCQTCRKIWGPKGAPSSYSDYSVRYPPILHGAKRHLTRPYSLGLTLEQVAKQTGRSWSGVRLAITNGTLRATKAGRTHYVTKTDATRWKARNCPVGGNEKSWLSLTAARTQYSFTIRQLRAYIDAGRLRSKVGTLGAMRGITYVLKQQARELRAEIGYSEKEAARRVAVSVDRLRVLLAGVDWRGAEGIPPETVQAAMRRRDSQDEGYTLEEAAAKLGKSKVWIHAHVLAGTIRLTRAKWDRRRLYITGPMLKRLRKAKAAPARKRFGPDWLFVGQASRLAGVCIATIDRWGRSREVVRQRSQTGWRYLRESVRARARRYWPTVRFLRATPPDWLNPSTTSPQPRLNPPKDETHDLAKRSDRQNPRDHSSSGIGVSAG